MADFFIAVGAVASVILLVAAKVRTVSRKSTCCGICCDRCRKCAHCTAEMTENKK